MSFWWLWLWITWVPPDLLDRMVMTVNWPEYSRGQFKGKSKKKNFFFFSESDWISAIFPPFHLFLPGNDLSFLKVSTMSIESTESFISSSRYPGLVTTFHEHHWANSLVFCALPVSLQCCRTMTSETYWCCPRTHPRCPRSGIPMGPSTGTIIQNTPPR